MLELPVIKILFFATLAFVFAMLSTPLLSHFLYKHKLGKKIRNNGSTPIFSKLHASKEGTPTMGGILIWGTVLIFIIVFSALANIYPNSIFSSRKSCFVFLEQKNPRCQATL
jgi:phospho-N-acetylmuramoyl-pentapeptide-transferase